MVVVIFDCETTGLPSVKTAHYSNLRAFDSARLVQVSWSVCDQTKSLQVLDSKTYVIRPDGFDIPVSEYHHVKLHKHYYKKNFKKDARTSHTLPECTWSTVQKSNLTPTFLSA